MKFFVNSCTRFLAEFNFRTTICVCVFVRFGLFKMCKEDKTIVCVCLYILVIFFTYLSMNST